MNSEVEAKYLELQAKPDRVIFSEIPEGDLHTVNESQSADSEDDGDDDFELSAPARNASNNTTEVVSTESLAADAAKAKEAGTAAKAENRTPVTERSHSEETGGDVLLDIARQEEAEARKRRKGRRIAGTRTVGGGFVMFCPYGCKIEVKEEHRGKTGRCPKCRAPFIVPIDPPMFKEEKTADGTPGETAAAAGAYEIWQTDLHMHVVSLEKLKLKADSLLKDFVEVDLAYGPDKLLVLELAKVGGGFFGGGDKKKLETRDASQQHLRAGKPSEELKVLQNLPYTKDQLEELKVVQPAASRTESVFHGIPVFGEGRIAVQLPFPDATKDPQYISMGLTQFWALSKALKNAYGIEGLGEDCGIPTEHVYSDQKCHFTNETFKSLENVALYKADPTVELEVVGYQCGSCQLTVSEVGRDREKLGGKTPKGIAKAKCPKCQQKMGENLLYVVKEAPKAEEPASAT
ncbi:MAG: hypothetical protein R3C18_22960 [Planctomycetaceae bacterium]